jgi:RNA 3'-terminal phosphate cyclase (ATP)
MVEVDGSYGEGGGQVLRTALTLAAHTGQPVHLRHIRARRRYPGLAPQHLTGVLALARICAAETSPLAVGCTDLVFRPGSPPVPGNYLFDVAQAAPGGSAGSVSLILQTLCLPLTLASCASRVTVRGGTHVPWSPPFEYLEQVYLPAIARMGLAAKCHLDAWGFYPSGGGQITADIGGLTAGRAGAAPAPLQLVERGALKRLTGHALACNLPAHVAQRIANRAHNVLSQAGLRAEIAPRLARGTGPGAYLWLAAEYEHGVAGFCALGEKGKPSEQVADEACRALLMHHAQSAPVDPHLADQLLLPLALADGRSEFRTSHVTAHLLTNAHIIRQFVPAVIDIAGQEGQAGAVVVQGVA